MEIQKQEIKPFSEAPGWTKTQGHCFSPFGPPVYVGKMDMSVIEEVQSHIESVRNDSSRDMGERLAGRIIQQYDISDLCSENVYGCIHAHLRNMCEGIEGVTGYSFGEFDFNGCQIDSLWVNIQKANEYNPPHLHDGMWSFVFYTKNDISQQEALDNHFDKQKGQSLGGALELRYGEMNWMNFAQYQHWPEVGDIIMFPSWLQHCVHSFYKEGAERISVAGNFQFVGSQGG